MELEDQLLKMKLKTRDLLET